MTYALLIVIYYSFFPRIQDNGKKCIEEEIARSNDAADLNKRLVLEGIINFYNFTCTVGGTNGNEII